MFCGSSLARAGLEVVCVDVSCLGIFVLGLSIVITLQISLAYLSGFETVFWSVRGYGVLEFGWCGDLGGRRSCLGLSLGVYLLWALGCPFFFQVSGFCFVWSLFATYGFFGFLVMDCGAYAQLRRSWSSRSPNVYVSHRWLLELMACSLGASVV
ncbi:hypothetical protein F2Q69_00034781 [Brassica cretica]|uniref:Uncharacterized protein n=1 Tax=Brassica cretica TaxID=69181 RepID=A0A8S9SLX7_BRACR|nr:hypothetical protein F2Q69_00034781 [Brassica cretica]